MIKYKIKKFVLFFVPITICLVFFWTYPVIVFMDWLNTDGSPSLREEEIFLNIMGINGNFIKPNNIFAIFAVIVILSLSFIFMSDKPILIARIKSRKKYVSMHLIEILIFSCIFVSLIEIINVIGAILFFGMDMVTKFKLIEYSMIDYITLFLFYSRMGTILLIVGIISNKKIAPFITVAIYIAESLSQNFFLIMERIWTPNKDAISGIYLLLGDITLIDTLPMIMRSLMINMLLIGVSYYLFDKKDLIDKKENIST